jgi:2-hydroxycyclohexanecarboxyl-CoA dehydrogenase
MPGLVGLTGRSVLVTGAASGIAKAISLRLGEEGAVVGAVDLDGPGAERTAAEITRAGGRAHAYAADIADGEAVERAVAAFARDAGAISGLVNAAGWDIAANFLDTAPADWRRIIDVNLYGPLHVTHAVLRRMVAAGAVES